MSNYKLPTKIPWSQAEIDALLLMVGQCARYGGEKTYGAIAKELSRKVGVDPQMPPRRGRSEGEDEFNIGMVHNQLERLERSNPELMPKTVRTKWKQPRTAKNREERKSMTGSSGSHVQQQKLPTFKPPSQATMAVSRPSGSYSQPAKLPGSSSDIGAHGHQGPPQHTNLQVPTIEPPSQKATMAVSAASGGHSQQAKVLRVDEMLTNDAKHHIPPQHASLPGNGGTLGSHGHRGASQQVNTPAMIGTSSSQHLHAGAQHPHSLAPISSERAFHPLSNHHQLQGLDLPPIMEPMGRCTLDSEPGGSYGQSHQHSGKGKIPALEPQLGGN